MSDEMRGPKTQQDALVSDERRLPTKFERNLTTERDALRARLAQAEADHH